MERDLHTLSIGHEIWANTMRDRITALLVAKQDEPSVALSKLLEDQGLKPCLVRSVSQAGAVLRQRSLPAAVFSATTLDDGTWADIVFLAAKASKPVPVIVVSRDANIKLYISALENGAADFIVPPFSVPEIAYVLRCAMAGGGKPVGRYRGTAAAQARSGD